MDALVARFYHRVRRYLRAFQARAHTLDEHRSTFLKLLFILCSSTLGCLFSLQAHEWTEANARAQCEMRERPSTDVWVTLLKHWHRDPLSFRRAQNLQNTLIGRSENLELFSGMIFRSENTFFFFLFPEDPVLPPTLLGCKTGSERSVARWIPIAHSSKGLQEALRLLEDRPCPPPIKRPRSVRRAWRHPKFLDI